VFTLDDSARKLLMPMLLDTREFGASNGIYNGYDKGYLVSFRQPRTNQTENSVAKNCRSENAWFTSVQSRL